MIIMSSPLATHLSQGKCKGNASKSMEMISPASTARTSFTVVVYGHLSRDKRRDKGPFLLPLLPDRPYLPKLTEKCGKGGRERGEGGRSSVKVGSCLRLLHQCVSIRFRGKSSSSMPNSPLTHPYPPWFLFYFIFIFLSSKISTYLSVYLFIYLPGYL